MVLCMCLQWVGQESSIQIPTNIFWGIRYILLNRLNTVKLGTVDHMLCWTVCFRPCRWMTNINEYSLEKTTWPQAYAPHPATSCCCWLGSVKVDLFCLKTFEVKHQFYMHAVMTHLISSYSPFPLTCRKNFRFPMAPACHGKRAPILRALLKIGAPGVAFLQNDAFMHVTHAHNCGVSACWRRMCCEVLILAVCLLFWCANVDLEEACIPDVLGFSDFFITQLKSNMLR